MPETGWHRVCTQIDSYAAHVRLPEKAKLTGEVHLLQKTVRNISSLLYLSMQTAPHVSA